MCFKKPFPVLSRSEAGDTRLPLLLVLSFSSSVCQEKEEKKRRGGLGTSSLDLSGTVDYGGGWEETGLAPNSGKRCLRDDGVKKRQILHLPGANRILPQK